MMLIPRRNYGLNLFDEFFNDPFFTGSREKAEEPKNLPVMRTDIREKDGNYLLDVELPGYSKEDIRIELKDGYLTITAQPRSAIFTESAIPVPAREAFMWANSSARRIFTQPLPTACCA